MDNKLDFRQNPDDLTVRGKSVLKEYINLFGPPSNRIRSKREGDPKRPEMLDILIWNADETCNVTQLATVGMSDKRLEKSKTDRIELHFAFSGNKKRDEVIAAAKFFASLCDFTFTSGNQYFPGYSMVVSGTVPFFSNAKSILFMPPAFIPQDKRIIDIENEKINFLQLLPLNEEESIILKATGIKGLLEYIERYKIDLFSQRELGLFSK